MASDNLQLDQLTGAENEKTNKVNEIFQQLEDALMENTTLAMADGNLAMTDAQFNRFGKFTVTSSPFTADRTLTIPARKKLFAIENQDTDEFRLVVQPSGGNPFHMHAGQTSILYSDGTDIVDLLGEGSWIDVNGTIGFASGNWANVGGSWEDAEFRRIAGGGKQLQGAVVNGVDSPPVNIFTLPVGMRPTADMEFLVRDSAGTAVIRITSAGVVSVQSGTISTRVHLDGIFF